ncbi:MAG: peptidoglycan-associated lipoprotein Pal [Pseudobdellovibrionaceae bacterium]|nr:peptidoglycan-associated lipoprotein Pal [Bdellovibrionales bacterium]USN46434.1 MAG: peptidoglycan-associated lipoprotein Pal [Pseudobdellovibrionaceae bacterium]
MTRLLSIALVTTSLIFAAGCGSKKKKGDQAGTPEGQISTQPLNFDPMGSDSGNIVGLKTINFDFDRATLTSDARRLLGENADWIRQNANVTVQVEGHCDKRGSVEYNLALGERRAQAVKNYLVSLGIPSKQLTVISYGKEKPVALGDSEADYASNRRANFVPLPQ